MDYYGGCRPTSEPSCLIGSQHRHYSTFHKSDATDNRFQKVALLKHSIRDLHGIMFSSIVVSPEGAIVPMKSPLLTARLYRYH